MVWFYSARAETPLPEVGYAIVTPQGGSVTSFVAVETLFNATGFGIAKTDVGPSPILTNAALPVNIGGASESGSALVLVNPSPNTATVQLVLSDSQGSAIANRTIMIADGDQVSLLVNNLFQLDLLGGSTSLLTMTSNIPVAILALDFRGVGFTSIPITNLDASDSVVTSTFRGTGVTIGVGSTFGVASTFGGARTVFGAAPTIFGTAQTTFGVAPTNIGVAPTTIGVLPTTVGVTPTTIGAAPAGMALNGICTTVPVIVPSAQARFLSTVTGFPDAFVFPQIATRGAAAASILIGNTSTVTQAVRFDFFNSAGDLIRTISNVLIAPHGFVVFSSENSGLIPTLQ
jgi:hypothetical protein